MSSTSTDSNATPVRGSAVLEVPAPAQPQSTARAHAGNSEAAMSYHARPLAVPSSTKTIIGSFAHPKPRLPSISRTILGAAADAAAAAPLTADDPSRRRPAATTIGLGFVDAVVGAPGRRPLPPVRPRGTLGGLGEGRRRRLPPPPMFLPQTYLVPCCEPAAPSGEVALPAVPMARLSIVALATVAACLVVALVILLVL